jgi:hypothetical protein
MRYFRSLTVAAAAVIAGLLSVPAFAIGTAANTTVTNSVSLTYQVNGFAQTPRTATVAFVVDRAIATLVSAQGATATRVTPGQDSTGASAYPALNFDVRNTGNDTQDLWLGVIERGAVNVTGLAGQGTGNAFVATAPIVAVDTNGNGTYEAGTDTVLTATGGHYVLSNVARDTTRRVLIVVNVPVAAADQDRDAYTLVAGVALAGGGALVSGDSNGRNAPGFSGAVTVADDIATAQNVFADVSTTNVEDVSYNFAANTAGVQDVVYNGQHSDTNAFVVAGARLFVGKVVQVLWDPINGNRYSANNSDALSGNNPKAIPGAVLMYAVGVSNDPGSPSTTGLNISDDLQSTGEIAVGNSNAVAGINVPQNVSVTLNAVPVSLDVPDSPNLNVISYHTCAAPAATATTTFAGGNPEVVVSLGACAANERGVVVYFVTLQ